MSVNEHNHGTVKVTKELEISQQISAKKNGIYNFVWTIPTTPEGESEYFKIHRETGQCAFRSGKVYCQDGPFQGPGEHFEFFYFINRGIVEIFVKMCFEPSPQTQIKSIEFKSNIPHTLDAGFMGVDKPPFPVEFLERSGKTCMRWIKNNLPLQASTEIRRLYIDVNMSKTWELNSLDEVADLHDSADFLQSHQSNPGPQKAILLKNLDLLFSPFCSDVKIRCGSGNQEYFAHKIILCSKSTVFLAMFSQPNMIENKTGEIVIEDFEQEIVEEFLRFLYTGRVNCLCKNVSDICLIADKYDVQSLKTLCENYLMCTISNENVQELENLGRILNLDKVVNKCNQIIKN